MFGNTLCPFRSQLERQQREAEVTAIGLPPAHTLVFTGTLPTHPRLPCCAACRTMTDAGPLTHMTNLQRLHVWLGANSELPCSNKPLRGLLAAVGKLTHLTELQLLKGLYLSWELRKIVQLDSLTDLQVSWGSDLSPQKRGETWVLWSGSCSMRQCFLV